MGGPEDDLVAALDALLQHNDLSEDEKRIVQEMRPRVAEGRFTEQDEAWIARVVDREYEKALAQEAADSEPPNWHWDP